MRALVGLLLVTTACGLPDLPDRSSPILVATEAPFVAAFAGGTDTDDDDPAWWQPTADHRGYEVWTRDGRLTDALEEPTGFGPGAIRAFDNGTVLTCGSGLARWENGTWTQIPFPALPDLVGDGNPICFGFAARDATEAWFVVGTGHLCRFDGEFDCTDVSQTITSDPLYGPRIINDVAMTESSVFITHPQSSTNTTELYVVDRGAPAASVRRIGTANGDVDRLIAVPGFDQAVAEVNDDNGAIDPILVGRDGVERSIDLGALGTGDDENLHIRMSVVPLADAIYVVVSRSYSTLECDEGECTETLHWSELVVLRDREGELVEVGHLGVEGDVLIGTGVRVDGELRIANSQRGAWRLVSPAGVRPRSRRCCLHSRPMRCPYNAAPISINETRPNPTMAMPLAMAPRSPPPPPASSVAAAHTTPAVLVSAMPPSIRLGTYEHPMSGLFTSRAAMNEHPARQTASARTRTFMAARRAT